MTGYYPVFNEHTDNSEFTDLFSVGLKCNLASQDKRVVVSTSLYFGTHSPNRFQRVEPSLDALHTPQRFVRAWRSWWDTYFAPFLKGCSQELPEGWIRRVHLDPHLKFLVPLMPRNVEIFLMNTPSWGAVPGMFWRYLPIEEDVLCVARGADNYFLRQQTIKLIQQALDDRVFLVRQVPTDLNGQSLHFRYRSILGSCTVRGPLAFVPYAAAWIERNKKRPFQTKVDAMPHLFHFGFSSWDAYGQDEQFLCRWLYYLAAARKTIGLHPKKMSGLIFEPDKTYYHNSRGEHTYFEL